jgi:hypothetical protein
MSDDNWRSFASIGNELLTLGQDGLTPNTATSEQCLLSALLAVLAELRKQGKRTSEIDKHAVSSGAYAAIRSFRPDGIRLALSEFPEEAIKCPWRIRFRMDCHDDTVGERPWLWTLRRGVELLRSIRQSFGSEFNEEHHAEEVAMFQKWRNRIRYLRRRKAK